MALLNEQRIASQGADNAPKVTIECGRCGGLFWEVIERIGDTIIVTCANCGKTRAHNPAVTVDCFGPFTAPAKPDASPLKRAIARAHRAAVGMATYWGGVEAYASWMDRGRKISLRSALRQWTAFYHATIDVVAVAKDGGERENTRIVGLRANGVWREVATVEAEDGDEG